MRRTDDDARSAGSSPPNARELSKGRARLRAAAARPPRSRHRRLRRLLICVGVLASLVGVGLIVAPLLAQRYLERRLIPRLAERLQRKVEVGRTDVGYGTVTLEQVTVHALADPPQRPMLEVARVGVSFRLLPLLGGRLVATRVEVERPLLRLFRGEDGRSNFVDLMERRGTRSRVGEGSGKLSGERLEVSGGAIEVDDRVHGLQLKAPRLTGSRVEGGAIEARLAEVTVDAPLLPRAATFERVDLSFGNGPRGGGVRSGAAGGSSPRVLLAGGRVRLLPGLLLSGIGGEVRYRDRRVTVDVSGSYGGATARLWAASGWFLPASRRGRLEVKAARFSLERIASILQTTPVISAHRTTVDGRLLATFERDAVALEGSLAFAGLNLFHPMLARTPVLDLALTTHLAARFDRPQRRLTIDRLHFKWRGVEASLTGTVARVGARPLVELRLQVPQVPCQQVLEAIPPSLVPRLQGFELAGKFAADLRTRIDYDDLAQTELGGSVGIRRCRVTRVPEALGAERLKQPFEHLVETAPGELLTIVVGPDNPDFAPYERISEHAVNAFLTTEDAAFFRHRGFITSQFRTALARNLKGGGFRIGASTITMQMVKNVLLSHEKTLSRKLQELVLTWYLEQELTKQRIMEIYLNAIEFGPGIYGIGAAARHYFGKAASELTPVEAAFFATILPSPKRRYVHYCHGQLTPKWDKYVRRILRRMHQRQRLSDTEYEEAQQETLVFSRDLDQLGDKDCNEQVKGLLEAWSDEYRRRLRAAVLGAAPHQLHLHVPAEDSGSRRSRQSAGERRR